jgi:hypothetical protein
MKIGDIVYVFDSNHRVYPEKKPGEGYSHSGPIYKEHFRPHRIIGETSSSWLVGFEHDGYQDLNNRYVTKHSKKEPHNGLYTAEQIDEQVYIHENAHKIQDAMRNVDYATLKKIAELINYKEAK